MSDPQQPSNSSDDRIRDVLETALQENFNHARHAEDQREKYLSMYWLLWGGVLAYVGREGKFKAAENTPFFAFLLVMSGLTLVLNLKLSAEFANHIAAVASIANKLGLNCPKTTQVTTQNWPLPYSEFSGYLALPLRMPTWLSVSTLLAGVHCLGVVLSVALMMYSWMQSLPISLFSGFIAMIFVGVICRVMYDTMKSEITARTLSINQKYSESPNDGQSVRSAK